MARGRVITINKKDLDGYHVPDGARIVANPGVTAIMGVSNGPGAFARYHANFKTNGSKVGGLPIHKTPPKRHRDNGAVRQAHYAGPGFTYPVRTFRRPGETVAQWHSRDRKLVKRALSYFGQHKHRYTPQVRKAVKCGIAKAARAVGQDTPRAMEYRTACGVDGTKSGKTRKNVGGEMPLYFRRVKRRVRRNDASGTDVGTMPTMRTRSFNPLPPPPPGKRLGIKYKPLTPPPRRFPSTRLRQAAAPTGRLPTFKIMPAAASLRGHTVRIEGPSPRRDTETEAARIAALEVEAKAKAEAKAKKAKKTSTKKPTAKKATPKGAKKMSAKKRKKGTLSAVAMPKNLIEYYRKQAEAKKEVAAAKADPTKSPKAKRVAVKKAEVKVATIKVAKAKKEVAAAKADPTKSPKAKKVAVKAASRKLATAKKDLTKAKKAKKVAVRAASPKKPSVKGRKKVAVKAAAGKRRKKVAVKAAPVKAAAGKRRKKASLKVAAGKKFTGQMSGILQMNRRRTFRRNFKRNGPYMQTVKSLAMPIMTGAGGYAAHRIGTTALAKLLASFRIDYLTPALAKVASALVVAGVGTWAASKFLPKYAFNASIGMGLSTFGVAVKQFLPEVADYAGFSDIPSANLLPRYSMNGAGEYFQAAAGRDPFLQAAAGGDPFLQAAAGEYYSTPQLGEYFSQDMFAVPGAEGSFAMSKIDVQGDTGAYEFHEAFSGVGAGPIMEGVTPNSDMDAAFNFMEAAAGVGVGATQGAADRSDYVPRERALPAGSQSTAQEEGIFDQGGIFAG
jgi:hypothetical protein